jgi:hypothetical protein
VVSTGKKGKRGVKKQVFLRVQGDFSTRSRYDGPSANRGQGVALYGVHSDFRWAHLVCLNVM